MSDDVTKTSNDRVAGTGGGCPFGFDRAEGTMPSRRALLAGLGAGAAFLGTCPASAQGSSEPRTHDRTIAADSMAADHSHDGAPHDFGDDGTREAHAFYGSHQAGIVNPAPAAAILASFDVVTSDRGDLQHLMRTLTKRVAFLMKGGEEPVHDPQMPPPDSGILGETIYPDNLTITVGLGASLFDQRFGLADEKPKHLTAMEQFANDALDADQCHGDLFIQFCSNTAETNLHALRDIVKATPGLMAIRWKMDGFLPPHTLKKLGKDTVRNLLGFKDGTANLDAADGKLMDDLVWVGRQHDEPAWAVGGSYGVVRLIRMLVERWDRTPLGEQQTIIGRQKGTGAPLGKTAEHEIPDFAGDPQGKVTPMDAHIRLANPRTPETAKNLILRRPYNYSREMTKAGQLDMGLAFLCFQGDLDAGFRKVQSRLDGEPLEEYIKPFGGGYFYILPGVRGPDDYFAKALIERQPV